MEKKCRAAKCKCTVEWQRILKREAAGTCYGERYIPYSTALQHYKALLKAMKKKGKHDKVDRPKYETVDKSVVLYQHKKNQPVQCTMEQHGVILGTNQVMMSTDNNEKEENMMGR